MTISQVSKVFSEMEKVHCPVTDHLIKGGFRQLSGGYISYARSVGINTDHQKGQPDQWWHLIKSYCERTDPDKVFGRRIVCGELIFYMAEALGCVDKRELEALADSILADGTPINGKVTPYSFSGKRRKWNKKIQELCFEPIRDTVEKLCSET